MMPITDSARRVAALTISVLAMAGCSFPSQNKSTVVRFHGEADDPAGDTASAADARVPRPADLIDAGIQVTDDAVHLTVRLAPGSLDPATTGVMILLDTDLDSTTGVPSFGLGADYLVSLETAPVREATVSQAVADPGCSSTGAPCRYEPIEHGEVAISNDEMDASVPRSVFARFDGPLNFRVVSYAVLDEGRLTVTSDHMPNGSGQVIAVR